MRKKLVLFGVVVLIAGLCLPVECSQIKSVEDIGMLSTEQASEEKGKEITFDVVNSWGTRQLHITTSYVRPNLEVYWSENASQIEAKLNDWYGDRKVLVVYVVAEQTSFFFPSNFAFTQGSNQYNIDLYEDVVKMTKTFEGGKLRKGVIARGLLAVPVDINTEKDYKLWYDDDFGVPKQYTYVNPSEDGD